MDTRFVELTSEMMRDITRTLYPLYKFPVSTVMMTTASYACWPDGAALFNVHHSNTFTPLCLPMCLSVVVCFSIDSLKQCRESMILVNVSNIATVTVCIVQAEITVHAVLLTACT